MLTKFLQDEIKEQIDDYWRKSHEKLYEKTMIEFLQKYNGIIPSGYQFECCSCHNQMQVSKNFSVETSDRIYLPTKLKISPLNMCNYCDMRRKGIQSYVFSDIYYFKKSLILSEEEIARIPNFMARSLTGRIF